MSGADILDTLFPERQTRMSAPLSNYGNGNVQPEEELQGHAQPPRDGVSDEGRPRAKRAQAAGDVGGSAAVRKNPDGARVRRKMGAARRPAVRERRHSHRTY